MIYRFDTLGATNVVASFGVDNGIFAWIDGVYLGGVRRGGGSSRASTSSTRATSTRDRTSCS